MAEIEVRPADPAETSAFLVRVTEGGSTSEHRVTLSESDAVRLVPGHDSKEEFIRACFEFLLEREPKESILPAFDVSEISMYFPEFEERIRR